MEQDRATKSPSRSANTPDMERRDSRVFQQEIEALINEAENIRLKHMKTARGRNFISISLGLVSILAGAGGFGWYLLMEGNIVMAVLCMFVAIIPPVIMHIWAQQPIKKYTRTHKSLFMPKFAELLGGLKFYPSRGISAKVISKTGVIPPYKKYMAEDCLMGTYQGVKVMISEARLYDQQKSDKALFDGVFVLLEIPSAVIEGHTIITSDRDMVQKWEHSRWQKLQTVPPQTQNPEWNRFHIFSDSPEAASLLIGEKLLKELSEAADIFGEHPLTAVLFRGKYVFIMIQNEEDMFEASNIHTPITTRQHAMNFKREIEQILEIIDVFELYKTDSAT